MTIFTPGRTVALRVLLLTVAAIALGTLINVYGAPAHRHHPPGTIVGKETPQLIPDEVAYRLVLNTIAGMAADPARQKALDGYFGYMERMGAAGIASTPQLKFAEQDRSTIQQVALELDTSSRRAATSNLRDVRAARTAVAMTRLDTELTPAGASIFRNFVATTAKRNMKVIPR